jgi:hypothetical protein
LTGNTSTSLHSAVNDLFHSLKVCCYITYVWCGIILKKETVWCGIILKKKETVSIKDSVNAFPFWIVLHFLDGLNKKNQKHDLSKGKPKKEAILK